MLFFIHNSLALIFNFHFLLFYILLQLFCMISSSFQLCDVFFIIYHTNILNSFMDSCFNPNLSQSHGIVLSTAWFFFANLGIWSLQFKSNRKAIYFHIICMLAAALLMAAGPTIMVVNCGLEILTFQWYHQLWGFICYCILPLILISGFSCKTSKDNPSLSPEKVLFRTKAHRIFGWIYIFLVTVPLLTGWFGPPNYTFVVIIFVDFVSFSLFVWFKFFGKKIGQVSTDQKINKNTYRQIRSLKDLRIYSENYFIFANYVYNLNNVINVHPVDGRQYNLFLYGVDPIQTQNAPKHSHSISSINLAGEPIAMLDIPSTYSQMEPLNKVDLSYMYCHDKKMTIHTIYFRLNQRCKFIGYQNLSQLGQYYSITVNKKITRLYTAVNFLQKSNIDLISDLSKRVEIIQHFYQQHNNNQEVIKQLNMNQSLVQNEKEQSSFNLLPLLMKKYSDGQFTSFFLNPESKIEEIFISRPRGLGLALDTVQKSNITILAGGTGLYPYSDLIDLLFKDKLINQGHPLSNIFVQSNPVLKHKPFKDMRFSIYLAVNQLKDLHPITMFELNELCYEDSKVKCMVKLKEANEKQFSQKYEKISRFGGRFEHIIGEQLKNDKDGIFYICGPIRFTKAIVQELKRLCVPPNNYKIV